MLQKCTLLLILTITILLTSFVAIEDTIIVNKRGNVTFTRILEQTAPLHSNICDTMTTSKRSWSTCKHDTNNHTLTLEKSYSDPNFTSLLGSNLIMLDPTRLFWQPTIDLPNHLMPNGQAIKFDNFVGMSAYSEWQELMIREGATWNLNIQMPSDIVFFQGQQVNRPASYTLDMLSFTGCDDANIDIAGNYLEGDTCMTISEGGAGIGNFSRIVGVFITIAILGLLASVTFRRLYS